MNVWLIRDHSSGISAERTLFAASIVPHCGSTTVTTIWRQNTIHRITAECPIRWYDTCHYMFEKIWREKINEPGRQPLERQTIWAVGRACTATFWPIPGFKERTLPISGPHTMETIMSASAVPHRDECLGHGAIPQGTVPASWVYGLGSQTCLLRASHERSARHRSADYCLARTILK